MTYKFPKQIAGPGTSTNNAIPTYSGTTGDVANDNSPWTISGDTLQGSDSSTVTISASGLGSSGTGILSASSASSAGGDAFSRYSVTATSTNWYLGIDNSDTQTFKMTYQSGGASNSIPTTTEVMRFRPTGVLNVLGFSINRAVTSINYNVKTTDYYVGVVTSAPVTITLLTTGLLSTQLFIIKDELGSAATNNISINAGGSVLIDGATSYVINTNYGSIQLLWNGTKYCIF